MRDCSHDKEYVASEEPHPFIKTTACVVECNNISEELESCISVTCSAVYCANSYKDSIRMVTMSRPLQMFLLSVVILTCTQIGATEDDGESLK